MDKAITVKEMRNLLNKYIEEGCGDDILVIQKLNRSDCGLVEQYKLEKGTIISDDFCYSNICWHSKKFVSDKEVEQDNDNHYEHYEYIDYEEEKKNIEKNFISRAIAIRI